ncbi:hypothetical protein ABH15_02490 [Methanoculleus taiwanensis]|uniref:Uncharacterized protein n=1 Tax=Methanoculleus taiwanensis TaxID=1550565 RepID=A0A498H2K7_9EURY|nr:hypothetical protein [Methanoculleus taiwanensis]RXE57023.1 hypothetical protein ABH15_02490 [Methanoculleus taiwanensis]
MISGDTAYLDLEFGYVYGTARAVIMPIEIGVVVHRREDDSVRYAGDVFRYGIDVEIWKKVADDCGRTVGVSTSVANTGEGVYGKPYDHYFRLSPERTVSAQTISRAAFDDLRAFMVGLLDSGQVSRLVVFAADMEKMAFREAGIPVESYTLVDLQREIKRQMSLRDVFSLDRVSRLVDFRTGDGVIASAHFEYPIPAAFQGCLAPHRGMGDAARIFLLSREFFDRREAFTKRIDALTRVCEASREPESGR